MNKFIPFPISGPEILSWSADVERLVPDLDINALARLMDAFKLGEITWDKEIGITNIFNGLKRLEKTEEGYRVIKLIY